jgi:hypothetical protein
VNFTFGKEIMKTTTKILPIIIVLNLLGFSLPASANVKKAEAFAQDIPKIFWYTLKEWGKLERGGTLEDSYEHFLVSRTCKLMGKVKTGDSQSLWKFHVFYSDNSEKKGEGWDFVFKLDKGEWHEVSGVRIVSGMKISLLKDVLASPGMRAQLKSALELHRTGKLDDAIRKIDKPNKTLHTNP